MYIIIGSVVGAVMLVLIAAIGFAIIMVGAHKCHKGRVLKKQHQINGKKFNKDLLW